MIGRAVRLLVGLWMGATLGLILSGCGTSSRPVAQPHPPIKWYTAGVPATRPNLIVSATHQRLPVIAWQWRTFTGLLQHETRRGIVPWNTTVIPVTTPRLTLAWTPHVSPNTVNVTIFRTLPVMNQPITPQQVLQTCMVNATYPTGHGCSLGAAGSLHIALTQASQRHGVGLMISAMWIPTHPVKSAAALDHQAVWIGKLSP